jgi:hypothetical protein
MKPTLSCWTTAGIASPTKQCLGNCLRHSNGDVAAVECALNNHLCDVVSAAAQILKHTRCLFLGCRQTLKHVAGDLMHSACVEVLAGISLDLSLGGWLGSHLAIKKIFSVIAVFVFFLGHINDALKRLKVSWVILFPALIHGHQNNN